MKKPEPWFGEHRNLHKPSVEECAEKAAAVIVSNWTKEKKLHEATKNLIAWFDSDGSSHLDTLENLLKAVKEAL